MRTRLAAFLSAFALLVLACTSMQPVTLAVDDDGRTVQMITGQELVLNLDSDRKGGYRWWLSDSTDVILIPLGKPGYASRGASKGAGGFEVWRFKAARTGTQVLRFEYTRSANDEDAPAKTLRYTVVVK
jgi:predicted secreted protein